jgi:hypothetical protein
MDAVWFLPGITIAERLVLLKIADNASEDGRNAWPSQATIAAACGMSVRGVQKALRRLVDLNYIEVQIPCNPRRPATYSVIVRGEYSSPQGRTQFGSDLNTVRVRGELCSDDPSLNRPRTVHEDQDHRADARPSHALLTRIGHEGPPADEDPYSDLNARELLKAVAARSKVPYDSASVAKARDAVLAQRRKNGQA